MVFDDVHCQFSSGFLGVTFEVILYLYHWYNKIVFVSNDCGGGSNV